MTQEQPMYMICFVVLIIYGVICFLINYRKYKKTKKSRYKIISTIFVVFIISASICEIALYNDYQYQLHHRYYKYKVELKSNSSGFDNIIIPVCKEGALKNKISIISGNCTKQIISTLYGEGMEINFTRKISIEGKLDTTEYGSVELTLLNKNQSNHSNNNGFHLNFWINYNPYDVNQYNCSIDIILYCDTIEYREQIWFDGYLINGWKLYKFEYDTFPVLY